MDIFWTRTAKRMPSLWKMIFIIRKNKILIFMGHQVHRIIITII